MEREQGRGHTPHLEQDDLDLDLGPAPGRINSAASMRAPERPIISGLVMRKANGDETHAHADHAISTASNSSGDELPAHLRGKFEQSLGTDLSTVRVHTGTASQQAAQAVGARAYAIGNDIHFGAHQYDPESASGQELIAHEVAHTVQQQGGTSAQQNKLEVSQPGDALEAEADRAAASMVRGAPVAVTSGGLSIARKKSKDDKGDKGKDGKDGKEKKPKYPAWENEKVNIPVGPIGDLTYDFKSGKGTFGKKGEGKKERKFFDIDKNLQKQVWGPFLLDLAININAKVAASAEGKLEGSWEPATGPFEGEEGSYMHTVTAQGGGAITLGAEGSVKAGLGFGVQNVLSVASGLSAGVECVSAVKAEATGSARRWPNNTGDGQIEFVVSGSVKFVAKAGIYVDYVGVKDRTNLYTAELGKHELGSAEVSWKPTWTPGSGFQLGEVSANATWNGLNSPGEKLKRKLNPSERKKLFPVEQGASGAPSHVPEETDCENDGAGGSAAECRKEKPPEPPETRPDDGTGGRPSNDSGASGAGGSGG